MCFQQGLQAQIWKNKDRASKSGISPNTPTHIQSPNFPQRLPVLDVIFADLVTFSGFLFHELGIGNSSLNQH